MCRWYSVTLLPYTVPTHEFSRAWDKAWWKQPDTVMGAPEAGPSRVLNNGLSAWYGTPVRDDPDYEYEYDLADTEDYYFTLDLTAQNAKAVGKAQALLNDEAETSKLPGQLQVSNLHSGDPLVSLQGTVYSCNWSTDYGTQVYITEPGVATNPRRPGNVLDVVAMSRTRLVAKPTTIQPPQFALRVASLGSSDATAFHIDEDESQTAGLNEKDLTNGPLSANNSKSRFATAGAAAKTPLQRAQVSFLERLSAIKQKRGETDLIPLYGVKQYKPPEDKEGIRKRALEDDPDHERYAEDPKVPRPKKQKVSRTVAEDVPTGL